MQYPILVVDKNIKVSEKEENAWLKHGISAVRVESMQKGIQKLTVDSFLFISINGDNINYMPLLKVMSDTTSTLVFIIDSGHTAEQETIAYTNGADAYATFDADPEKNVQLALALLLRHRERSRQPRIPSGMINYENFLVLSDTRRIYYNDERMKLTRMEYDLLHYFIINHDLSLSYKKIYRKIWGGDIEETSRRPLFVFVDKLNKKITEVSGGRKYITNERGHGYVFSAENDSQS